MPSTHLSLHYHIVFGTKNHEPFIQREWREKLHAYLGLSETYIRDSNLRVSYPRFEKELLRTSDAMVGRLDSRFVSYGLDAAADSPEWDPADVAVTGAYVGAFGRYVHDQLHYTTNMVYRPTAYTQLGEFGVEHTKPEGPRQQRDLPWHEHTQQHAGEQSLGPRKTPFADNIAVHRPKRRRYHRGGNGHPDRVPEIVLHPLAIAADAIGAPRLRPGIQMKERSEASSGSSICDGRGT